MSACPKEYVIGPLGDTVAFCVMAVLILFCFASLFWEFRR